MGDPHAAHAIGHGCHGDAACWAVAGELFEFGEAVFQRFAKITCNDYLAEGVTSVGRGIQSHAAEVAGAAGVDTPDGPWRGVSVS